MSISRDRMIYFECELCRKINFWNKNMRYEDCIKQSNPKSKIEIKSIDQGNKTYQQIINEEIIKQNLLEN